MLLVLFLSMDDCSVNFSIWGFLQSIWIVTWHAFQLCVFDGECTIEYLYNLISCLSITNDSLCITIPEVMVIYLMELTINYECNRDVKLTITHIVIRSFNGNFV